MTFTAEKLSTIDYYRYWNEEFVFSLTDTKYSIRKHFIKVYFKKHWWQFWIKPLVFAQEEQVLRTDDKGGWTQVLPDEFINLRKQLAKWSLANTNVFPNDE